jgi:1-deoxy-D-xylulose-5-phosphate synthase
VGEDGATHHGLFDIAYLRHIPNLVSMAPKDCDELKGMLEWAVNYSRPVAIRYPRGKAASMDEKPTPIEMGKAEVLKQGSDLAIFALGSMVGPAVSASQILEKEGLNAAVVNARFVNPLDEKVLSDFAVKTKKIVCVEEGVLDGGFGSHVLETLERLGIEGVQAKRIGLPNEFIEHGKKEQLLDMYGLNARGIAKSIRESLYGVYKDKSR